MPKIIGKMRFNAETKKINSGVFSLGVNYSKNSEYIEMIKSKNYIEVSQEQADLWTSNNQNGIEMCVIDDILQSFIEADTVKLERAKEAKLSELESFYSSDKNWEIAIKHTGDIKPALQPLVLQQNTIGKFATTIYFADVNGDEYQILLTNAKAIVMLNENTLIGYALKKKNLELVSQISNAKSVEDIEKINIEKEFATVKKIITIS